MLKGRKKSWPGLLLCHDSCHLVTPALRDRVYRNDRVQKGKNDARCTSFAVGSRGTANDQLSQQI